MAIIGAGPRGAGIIERIGANAAEFPAATLRIHLIDPHPPGAGRVWRRDQSPLLAMNSMAEDVTMFTDESVRCAGPIRPGPTLAEWARGRVAPDEFATRQVQAGYLAWFYRRAIDELPPGIQVVEHRDTALCLDGTRVTLAGGTVLSVDTVVVAAGHVDTAPNPEQQRLAEYAAANDLYYLPPVYTADTDLSGVPAGEPVILRGFGLAFIDLMVLLTEGRGGRFTRTGDGPLEYHPSGAEPILYAGSRRGVPYHGKTNYRLCGDKPEPLQYFTPDAIESLIAGEPVVTFHEHAWPLIVKDLQLGYYRELFTGHPDKVTAPWPEFLARFQRTEDITDLVRETVPDPADRLDFADLDRPMRGRTFPDHAALENHITEYIEADLARRHNPEFSADLGLFISLLRVYGQLPKLSTAPNFDPESRRTEFEDWWCGFFSYYASGPPGFRLEELLALHRAGIVRYLGPDMWLTTENGRFQAGSAAAPHTIETHALIEARIPSANAATTTNPVLRALPQRDGSVPVDPQTHRVIGMDAVYAVGPYTSVRTPAAFARPHTNAPAFRINDQVARAILQDSVSRVRPAQLSGTP